MSERDAGRGLGAAFAMALTMVVSAGVQLTMLLVPFAFIRININNVYVQNKLLSFKYKKQTLLPLYSL